jgi:16S rRNA processing protein RimM
MSRETRAEVEGDFLAIGRLGSPKGVRGDLKIHSYSGESAHFLKLKEATLRGLSPTGAPRELKLKVARVSAPGAADSLTIAFDGYASPESARALTGLDIVVPRSEAAALRPDEWYVTDLVGLALVAGGEKLATVRAVLEGGPDPWLEAVLPGGGTALVPFRKIFVGEVDLEAGTIELFAPELLEP